MYHLYLLYQMSDKQTNPLDGKRLQLPTGTCHTSGVTNGVFIIGQIPQYYVRIVKPSLHKCIFYRLYYNALRNFSTTDCVLPLRLASFYSTPPSLKWLAVFNCAFLKTLSTSYLKLDYGMNCRLQYFRTLFLSTLTLLSITYGSKL